VVVAVNDFKFFKIALPASHAPRPLRRRLVAVHNINFFIVMFARALRPRQLRF
jgi:hypothetical protein